MSTTPVPPIDLQEGKLIWVTVGKTAHSAHFRQWIGSEALVEWSNGHKECVSHRDITTELSPRSGRNKRTSSGHMKEECASAESEAGALAPSAIVSSSENSAEGPIPDSPVSSALQLSTQGEDSSDAPLPAPVSSGEDPGHPVPDSPVSSSPGLLQSMQHDVLDIRIKQEGEHVLDSKQRQQKKKELLAKIKANKDPDGNPRFVFRRGCHPQCITTVLGGCGTHNCPTVHNVPEIGKDFIQSGEFYFAGIESFNSFCPKYPGDSGFVGSHAFKYHPDQTKFHLFVQCSKRQFHAFWHGENAKEGYLYLGRYEVGNRDVEPTMKFVQLDPEYQNTIIDYYLARPSHTRYKKWDNEKEYYANLVMQDLEVGEWNQLTPQERNRLEMRALLEEEDFELDTTPVKFDSYDEKLYQALVGVGAAKVTRTQTGRVAIDARGLGYPVGLLQ